MLVQVVMSLFVSERRRTWTWTWAGHGNGQGLYGQGVHGRGHCGLEHCGHCGMGIVFVGGSVVWAWTGLAWA
jgi:hypothetical protein